MIVVGKPLRRATGSVLRITPVVVCLCVHTGQHLPWNIPFPKTRHLWTPRIAFAHPVQGVTVPSQPAQECSCFRHKLGIETLHPIFVTLSRFWTHALARDRRRVVLFKAHPTKPCPAAQRASPGRLRWLCCPEVHHDFPQLARVWQVFPVLSQGDADHHRYLWTRDIV